ncbi:flavin-containing amine oxidoreductase-domain containing protein [Suillus lakei]|nr:flavin-containing amine oxidoreductase-domain containing protein [Suillus lakei]
MHQVHLAVLLSFAIFATAFPSPATAQNEHRSTKDAKVLILGGDAEDTIAVPGKQYTVKVDSNWIQGTQTGNGTANPILTLARKHHVKNHDLRLKDCRGMFDTSIDQFTQIGAVAGERVKTGAYGITGATPKNIYEAACQYYEVDWSPDQNSWIASAWNNNFTFDTDMGGFSDENNLCIDQRGFKTTIQAEAAEFIQPKQVSLNSLVTMIAYSEDGVTVTLADNTTLTGDYVLCTFSLGVLQYGDVVFEPALPSWKMEAIQSMVMATYTKIFLQFEKKFWFDTEMAIYADKERGRYPIWQSLDHVNFSPGSGLVFVTVTGDFSLRIEGMEDSDVQEEVIEVLGAMYPNTTISNAGTQTPSSVAPTPTGLLLSFPVTLKI